MTMPTHDFKPGEILELIACPVTNMPLGTRITVVEAPRNNMELSPHTVFYEGKSGHVTWRPANYFKRSSPIMTETETVTVTKTSLIEGVYGRLKINKTYADGDPHVGLKLTDRNGNVIANEFGAGLTAVELRQMSQTLLEFAVFLESQNNA